MQVAKRKFFDYLKVKYKEKNNTIFTENNVKELSEEITDIIDVTYEKEKSLMTHIAIDNLKEEHREVLLLKYLEDKSIKKIAKIMKKSASSVQGLLFRARQKVKKELKKQQRIFN